MGTYRKVVLLYGLSVLVENVEGRVLGLILGLYDDLVVAAGNTVGNFLDESSAFNEVLELCASCIFNDGDGVVCVPFADEVSLDYAVAFLLVKNCSVRDVILGECHSGVLVLNAEFSRAADYNILDFTDKIYPLYGPQFRECKLSCVF